MDICCRPRNIARDNTLKQQLLSDPSVVEQIRAYHREDMKLYRYVCDVIYPRQVREYGPQLSADVSALMARQRVARHPVVRPNLLWASAKRNFVYKPLAHFRRSA